MQYTNTFCSFSCRHDASDVMTKYFSTEGTKDVILWEKYQNKGGLLK